METTKIKTVLLIFDFSVYMESKMWQSDIWWRLWSADEAQCQCQWAIWSDQMIWVTPDRGYTWSCYFWHYNLWMFCFIFLTLLKFESFAEYNYRETCWCLGNLDLRISNKIVFSLNWCANRWSIVCSELLGESFDGRRSREICRSGPMTVLSVITWSVSLLWFA